MYLKHCKLTVWKMANAKRTAEHYAKEYTKKEWIQYLVFYHTKFEHYIVHKEEYLNYFIKNIWSPTDQNWQLSLTF